MRLLNALCAGLLTGAQLETLLADPTRLDEFRSLFLLGQRCRLWYSEVGMNAVAASRTAKMAIFGSDFALSAIAASDTAPIALRTAPGYAVISKNAGAGAQTVPGPGAGQSYILVGVSCSSTAQTITGLTTLRSGSTRPVTATADKTSTSGEITAMCTPLTGPITFTTNSTITNAWYFGLLRCDV